MKFISCIEQNPFLIQFINPILSTSKHRIIILFQERNYNYAYGSCLNKYYKPLDPIGVSGLFTVSFDLLKARPGAFWSIDDLPLIETMGLFQLSFIEQDITGKVTVSDGLCHPFAYHLWID